eukprot:jgi/Picsp_1/5746/NSC_03105-R1_sumo-activating enzyme subunit 1b
MEGLTAEEKAVYDRQLRVWGLEAQQRLRRSRVLILGCSGAAFEVAKNLVLAGIGEIMLIDDLRVSESQFQANFLLDEAIGPDEFVAQACIRTLKEMNPMVLVQANNESPGVFLARGGDLCGYGIALCFNLDAGTIGKADEICSGSNLPIMTSNCRGVSGWIFSNPQIHSYVVEEFTENDKGETENKIKRCVMKGTPFFEFTKKLSSANPRRRSPLLDVIKVCLRFEMENGVPVNENCLDKLRNSIEIQGLRNTTETLTVLNSYVLESEGIAPVLAIVGGVLANDVIKILSKKGEPGIQDAFFYSTIDDGGWVGLG